MGRRVPSGPGPDQGFFLLKGSVSCIVFLILNELITLIQCGMKPTTFASLALIVLPSPRVWEDNSRGEETCNHYFHLYFTPFWEVKLLVCHLGRAPVCRGPSASQSDGSFLSAGPQTSRYFGSTFQQKQLSPVSPPPLPV